MPMTVSAKTVRDLEFFGYFPEGPKICADLKLRWEMSV